MSTIHRFPIRIYFDDTDAGGVAYHANYLKWAERARTESLRDMGLPHSLMMETYSAMLVVRRIEVEYVAPARLDDALLVTTRLRAFGAASLDLDQTVTRPMRDGAGEVVLARLGIGLVCVRADGLRPIRLPAPWRDAFAALAMDGRAAQAARIRAAAQAAGK